MRTVVAIVLTVSFLACAGGETSERPGDPSAPRSVRLQGIGGNLEGELTRDGATITGLVDAPLREVWKHLPDAYEELGIDAGQLTIVNPGAHQIGFERQRLRTLNGRRLSSYLHCGYTAAGATADRGDTVVTLTTWLESRDGQTAVRTTLLATAREGSSTRPVSCSSLGQFEQELVAGLRARLAESGSRP